VAFIELECNERPQPAARDRGFRGHEEIPRALAGHQLLFVTANRGGQYQDYQTIAKSGYLAFVRKE